MLHFSLYIFAKYIAKIMLIQDKKHEKPTISQEGNFWKKYATKLKLPQEIQWKNIHTAEWKKELIVTIEKIDML